MAKSAMRPIHPGEILREEYLVPLGMSAHALAMALRVPAPRINELVRERRGVTPDTALRLARYFGGDAESWLALQVAYDLRLAELAAGDRIAREVAPRAA
jgi:addiction module HigA family antidote